MNNGFLSGEIGFFSFILFLIGVCCMIRGFAGIYDNSKKGLRYWGAGIILVGNPLWFAIPLWVLFDG